MSSDAQIRANQANAQKSTGPRTDAGKSRSSQNARIHGLCAKSLVFTSPEEREAFLERCQELSDQYPFEHALKQSLVTAVASAEVQIRFANLAKRGVLRCVAESGRTHNPNPPEPGTDAHVDMAMDALAVALLRYTENIDCLVKLNRYEVEQRRLFYKALQQLEALRPAEVSRRPAQARPSYPETKPTSKPKNPPPSPKFRPKAA